MALLVLMPLLGYILVQRVRILWFLFALLHHHDTFYLYDEFLRWEHIF